MARHNETGAFGEQLVREMFQEAGLPVTESAIADVCIAGVDLEVKTARLSQWYRDYRGYQFSLEREGHSSLTADVLVLVALDEVAGQAVFFVIPAAAVEGQRKLTVPSPDPLAYGGKWAEWRGRWDVIAEMAG